jgi:hypothetical protein
MQHSGSLDEGLSEAESVEEQERVRLSVILVRSHMELCDRVDDGDISATL